MGLPSGTCPNIEAVPSTCTVRRCLAKGESPRLPRSFPRRCMACCMPARSLGRFLASYSLDPCAFEGPPSRALLQSSSATLAAQICEPRGRRHCCGSSVHVTSGGASVYPCPLRSTISLRRAKAWLQRPSFAAHWQLHSEIEPSAAIVVDTLYGLPVFLWLR